MIPEDQLCQAFDPMMFLEEKNLKKDDSSFVMSTSCVAPAYAYIEGSHGKKFLCDFHYFYEQRMVSLKNIRDWAAVAEVCLENFESIKDTFDKTVTERTIFEKCWCEEDAFVEIDTRVINSSRFFCNFHFRKFYYRSITNSIQVPKSAILKDERIFMTKTIKQEAISLKLL